MRALKLILTLILAAIALTAGFFVAAAAALVAVAVFAVGRLFGPTRIRVSGSTRFPRRPKAQVPSDAIDVTATEVSLDPPKPLPASSGDDQRIRA